MLLAGDLGGTKTLLGLFAHGGDRPGAIEVREFATLHYAGLTDMISEFLREHEAGIVDAACFGVAGPVREGSARLTNVPWAVDAGEIAEHCGCAAVTLLNDLEAMAWAVPVLRRDELAVLQGGESSPEGNAALIAAGTGLGEALLHNVGGRFIPSPSEGGHADFAARTPREMELARDLATVYGRVQNEHVISGPGLVNLFRFTHQGDCPVVHERGNPAELPAWISASAMEGRCPECQEALALFVSAFGAEAGNLVLRWMATAGVYLGGGIAPKILPALRQGSFMDAFRVKEPLTDLLAATPVLVILNVQAGLLGAAVRADLMTLEHEPGSRE